MDLFVPAMVFNSNLRMKSIRTTGHDYEGYPVEVSGIVTDVRAEYIEVMTNSRKIFIYSYDVGPELVKIELAGKWTELPDNREEAKNRENS